MFPLLMSVLTIIILLHFLSLIQECFHWIKHVGIRFRFTKFDVNYGVGLSFP